MKLTQHAFHLNGCLQFNLTCCMNWFACATHINAGKSLPRVRKRATCFYFFFLFHWIECKYKKYPRVVHSLFHFSIIQRIEKKKTKTTHSHEQNTESITIVAFSRVLFECARFRLPGFFSLLNVFWVVGNYAFYVSFFFPRIKDLNLLSENGKKMCCSYLEISISVVMSENPPYVMFANVLPADDQVTLCIRLHSLSNENEFLF